MAINSRKGTQGMKENVRLALRGIRTHKMRSFLTMLGIIIGIAAIIAIVSTIKGTNEQIKRNLIGSGTNTVTVQLNQGDYPYDFSYQSAPDGVAPVSAEVVQQLSQISHVTSVSLVLSRSSADYVFHAGQNFSGGAVLGIDENYLATAGYQVTRGRGFVEADYQGCHKIALIDETAYRSLYSGGEPIGTTIEIRGEPFTVVGMIRPREEFEPVIESVQDYETYHQQSAGTVYIPANDWPIVFAFDEPQTVLIGIDQTDAMTSVGQKAAQILNDSIHPADTTVQYAATDLLKQAEQLQQLSRSTNNMLIWIAAISLLVGGIGVMNIMLVSVTERTREIGLKKALGAKKSSIRAQFLTEAAVLTSLGGAVGIVAGIALAYIVSAAAQVPVAISTPAIIIAFFFSMAVGIIFGLLPSIKASNLDPIEALRYE
jgi:putative ABC transport system permease protein